MKRRNFIGKSSSQSATDYTLQTGIIERKMKEYRNVISRIESDHVPLCIFLLYTSPRHAFQNSILLYPRFLINNPTKLMIIFTSVPGDVKMFVRNSFTNIL